MSDSQNLKRFQFQKLKKNRVAKNRPLKYFVNVVNKLSWAFNYFKFQRIQISFTLENYGKEDYQLVS